jgi:polyisoprenoid-binding protein YceI
MHRIKFAFAAAMLALASMDASAAERPLLAKGSSINFTFSQMNVAVDGSFKRFSGKINLDAARPENSCVDLQVDVASVSAGEDADAEVIKPGWLDAAGHPQARFLSKSVKSLGGGRYQASGALTIKGISRDTTVPFTVKDLADGSSEVSGQFTLRRGDYKIGEGEWSAFDVVANDVQVKFKLLLGPTAAAKRR